MTPTKLAAYRKALVGIAGAVAQALSLGILHGQALTIATLALAALTAVGVYAAPNSSPVVYSERDAAAHLAAGDAGHSDVDTVLLVLAVVGVLLLLVGVTLR